MRHFPAAEFEGHLDLHVLAQKTDGVFDFDPQVVGINFWAELDFLYLGRVLVLLGFLVPLGLLVAILTVIHQSADRWVGGGCDFDQIHGVGPGHGQRFAQREDPKLFAIITDHSVFAGTDFPIYPDERTGWRRVTCRNWATQDTLVGWNLFMQSVTEP